MEIFIQPYRIADLILKHKKEDFNFFDFCFLYSVILHSFSFLLLDKMERQIKFFYSSSTNIQILIPKTP